MPKYRSVIFKSFKPNFNDFKYFHKKFEISTCIELIVKLKYPLLIPFITTVYMAFYEFHIVA